MKKANYDIHVCVCVCVCVCVSVDPKDLNANI